jgi:DNA excision repair protein ERCC-2
METLFFPHEKIRPIQKDIIEDIAKAIENKEHIIFHAPTGLGKSAASLAPAVTYAKKHKCTVFFLTSRHTQHEIAIQTLQEIKEKHQIDLKVADIIGKKWMCLQPAVQDLGSGEFTEFCKQTVAAGKCDFYTNTRKTYELAAKGKLALEQSKRNICHSEELIQIGRNNEVCPYEITIELIKEADVIVGDYSYIFHPMISELLLKKTGKSLDTAIVIVDEAHNLPSRVRKAASVRLTTFMIKNAIKEAKKYNYQETLQSLVHMQNILNDKTAGMQIYQQKLVKKEDFTNKINEHKEYNKLIDDLTFIAEAIRELQKKSAIGGIVSFLEAWRGESIGFARIIEVTKSKNKETVTQLHYKCLDPATITKEIIQQTHSTILMSGTLTPTNMYRDILGFDKENTTEQVYGSPFPEKNRLVLVVPKTTTKFSQRSEQQFNAIAQECAIIANTVQGNSIIFFPSYAMRDKVYTYFSTACKKTVFMEVPGMSKEDKAELLERFKAYKATGAVLLAAVSGSYGEGVDLPGDLLKCVVVVGLPLTSPDLETKQLIEYFDQKFKRGWDYGYVFPAFNKALQNAGRCIRTEKDRGVIVFLDERYIWPMYSRCFPRDLGVEMTKEPEMDIKLFFGKN